AVAGLHSLDDERQRAQTCRHRGQLRQAQALVRAERRATGPNERRNRLRHPTTTWAVRLSEKCRGSEREGAYDNGQRPEFGHGFSPCGGWIPLASAAAQDRTPARRPALAARPHLTCQGVARRTVPLAAVRSRRSAGRGAEVQRPAGISVARLVLDPFRGAAAPSAADRPAVATGAAATWGDASP